MNPEDLAFDAEAIVAFFAGEPGGEQTVEAIRPVASGQCKGYLSEVNAAEVWYVLKRRAGAHDADECLAWLQNEARIEFVPSQETWRRAALLKADHRMSLGDSFAMATAYVRECAVLTGNDPEFAGGQAAGIPVRRIRPARDPA